MTVEELDDSVGTVVAARERLGLAGDTLLQEPKLPPLASAGV